VLKWDEERTKSQKYKKLKSLWFEPYLIAMRAKKNAFKIAKLNGWKLQILVNG